MHLAADSAQDFFIPVGGRLNTWFFVHKSAGSRVWLVSTLVDWLCQFLFMAINVINLTIRKQIENGGKLFIFYGLLYIDFQAALLFLENIYAMY